MAAASSSQAAPGLPYLSRPKVIIAQEAPSPNVIIPAIPEGPSKNVLQATQDVCDHLARMAGRVSDLFDMFDVDKNGLIDKKEFRAACLHVGITYPPDVIDQVFALLDEDGSGSLEHMEVIRTARRAAFERGFVPRVPPKPPAHQRRLNAYWARRNRMHMEAHEESVRKIEAQVQEALAETVNAPVLFLPTLPEAKAIAKATWAKDPTAPKRAVELDETIREVSALQDVWIGSLVKKWQAPDPTVKAASQLRGGFSRNKGRAPQASQFRNIVTPSSRNLNSRGGPASPHSPQSQFINIVAAPASAPQVRSTVNTTRCPATVNTSLRSPGALALCSKGPRIVLQTQAALTKGEQGTRQEPEPLVILKPNGARRLYSR
ncbi:hypothetical protein Ctob_013148 [Chrysochromulina tobinii]|uniref:EF-hand domain-containing protein n=1 Tax=Chrysochromulina tobinii TaxID=1460289 RepID=A0A0M0K5D9_9EUKA|nr:hypothetical protein Ctob_013148 [Chrysochromulina tobinii]|eukprot:KOO34014.1 hypothetical protein Ctob_013148 [Chrysochromulina sp. CCMP291]